jgi:hypothetical protein
MQRVNKEVNKVTSSWLITSTCQYDARNHERKICTLYNVCVCVFFLTRSPAHL